MPVFMLVSRVKPGSIPTVRLTHRVTPKIPRSPPRRGIYLLPKWTIIRALTHTTNHQAAAGQRVSIPREERIEMGRTMPTAAMSFLQQQKAFLRFKRALSRQDQLRVEELFVNARKHMAVIQYASHILPFETMALAMLLEEHKEVMKLREAVETLERQRRGALPAGEGDRGAKNGEGTRE